MKKISVSDIVAFLERNNFTFQVKGKKDITVTGFSSFVNYKEHTITWLKSDKLGSGNHNREIAVCIAQDSIDVKAQTVISCSNSKGVFFSILEEFFGDHSTGEPIGAGTVIGVGVTLGKNVQIGTNCSIVGDVKIGDGTIIGDNVVIRNCVTIGENCIIQSLTVIGEDGYGYSEDENHVKTMIKHYGGVVIGNNVFIGSHVNIARGTIDDTVIGNGVKIAPTTHIGHNNLVKDNASVICSQLFGSVITGENAYITSSVIRNQCEIGADSIVGMGSVVTKNVPPGKVVIGAPAKILRNSI
ncbi:DapH/DapD/GlmU-related protein [Anaerovorax sp. IOR16]|uniref:DapH/DapD/GlmU-related protein n=1 Tax=Anaerovorax sp. IOR16 TaxID=2773458 RepID=UPI0019D2D5B6|nr:DapH/DapD/GlmU-related protein [Anaerovorax sp. IOR16]